MRRRSPARTSTVGRMDFTWKWAIRPVCARKSTLNGGYRAEKQVRDKPFNISTSSACAQHMLTRNKKQIKIKIQIHCFYLSPFTFPL